VTETRTTDAGSTAGRAAVWWAVAGVAAILAEAVVSLAAIGLATLRAGLSPLEWLAFFVCATGFFYGEGVRALQRRWVPFVMRRAASLRHTGSTLDRVLAPLYAMALVGAPRATLLRAWAGVAGIVLAVVVVSRLPAPWRGIVDLSVALALAWGLLAVVRCAIRMLPMPAASGIERGGSDRPRD